MNIRNLSSTILLLARHGETEANVAGSWQGSTDSPLNGRGREQAGALAARLASEQRDVVAVYSSPLSRACTTAEIVAAALNDVPVYTDPGLAEFNLGEWEGLSYETLRFEKRLWERMAADPTFTPPGGESAVSFAMRLVGSFRAIVAQHMGQEIVVIGHGGALATALAMILDNQGSAWPKYQMDNCGLTEIEMLPAPRLVRFNDVAHLDGIGTHVLWNQG